MGPCSVTSGIEQSQDIDQQANFNLRLGLLVASVMTGLAFTSLHRLNLGGWNTAASPLLETIFWSILPRIGVVLNSEERMKTGSIATYFPMAHSSAVLMNVLYGDTLLPHIA